MAVSPSATHAVFDRGFNNIKYSLIVELPTGLDECIKYLATQWPGLLVMGSENANVCIEGKNLLDWNTHQFKSLSVCRRHHHHHYDEID